MEGGRRNKTIKTVIVLGCEFSIRGASFVLFMPFYSYTPPTYHNFVDVSILYMVFLKNNVL